jgi:hypothetical protein
VVECRHVLLLVLRLVFLSFLVLFFLLVLLFPPLVGVQQRLLILLGLEFPGFCIDLRQSEG